MSDIIFAPLEDSPETIGSGVAQLPAIWAYGTDTLNYGIGFLPPIGALGSGDYVEINSGTGIALLPSVWAFGTDTLNYGVGYIPPIGSIGYGSIATPLPSHGDGIAPLPMITTYGVGFVTDFGEGVVQLRPIVSYGFEVSDGTWGINPLPRIGALGVDVVVAPTDYLTLVGPAHYGYIIEASTNGFDKFRLIDEAFFNHIIPAGDNWSPVDRATSIGHFIRAARDKMEFVDSMQWLFLLAATDDFILQVSQENWRVRIERVIDSLLATDSASSVLHAKNMVVDALILDDLAQRGYGYELSDSLLLSDDVQQSLRLLFEMVDTLSLTDVAAGSGKITAVTSDVLQLNDIASSIGNFINAAGDTLSLIGTLAILDGVYTAWVLNPRNRAAWQYSNYGFNSMANFGGKTYGMMDGGLYEITGSDDAGSDIRAYVKTGILNFGSSQLKRVPYAYMYIKTGGNDDQMVLKVTVPNENNEKVTYWYNIEQRQGPTRAKIGEGVVAVDWQLTIANIEGADFDVSGWRILPVYLKRRI